MATRTESGWGGFVPQPVRVLARTSEAAGVRTLWLQAPPGFSFLPGQFNMLYAFGVGEVPISISGGAKDGRLAHTVRSVGSISRALWQAKPGEVLGLRGPFGRGWPLAAAQGRDVLIIAGGLGLAPLRPVIRHLLARRKEYGHITLLYGARSPAALIFKRDLHRWRARFDMLVRITVDSADEDWQGHVGVVTSFLPHLEITPKQTLAFVCGPEVMMRFTAQALRQRGLPAANIFASLERNMQCAVGHCGHCQLGPEFVCRDGPVFSYERIGPLLAVPEL